MYEIFVGTLLGADGSDLGIPVCTANYQTEHDPDCNFQGLDYGPTWNGCEAVHPCAIGDFSFYYPYYMMDGEAGTTSTGLIAKQCCQMSYGGDASAVSRCPNDWGVNDCVHSQSGLYQGFEGILTGTINPPNTSFLGDYYSSSFPYSGATDGVYGNVQIIRAYECDVPSILPQTPGNPPLNLVPTAITAGYLAIGNEFSDLKTNGQPINKSCVNNECIGDAECWSCANQLTGQPGHYCNDDSDCYGRSVRVLAGGNPTGWEWLGNGAHGLTDCGDYDLGDDGTDWKLIDIYDTETYFQSQDLHPSFFSGTNNTNNDSDLMYRKVCGVIFGTKAPEAWEACTTIGNTSDNSTEDYCHNIWSQSWNGWAANQAMGTQYDIGHPDAPWAPNYEPGISTWSADWIYDFCDTPYQGPLPMTGETVNYVPTSENTYWVGLHQMICNYNPVCPNPDFANHEWDSLPGLDFYHDKLVISEIKWRPHKSEFIELYNRWHSPINLRGMHVMAVKWGEGQGGVGYGLPDVEIQPGEYLVLCDSPTWHVWDQMGTDLEWLQYHCPDCWPDGWGDNCPGCLWHCMGGDGSYYDLIAPDTDFQGVQQLHEAPCYYPTLNNNQCLQWPQPYGGHTGGGYQNERTITGPNAFGDMITVTYGGSTVATDGLHGYHCDWDSYGEHGEDHCNCDNMWGRCNYSNPEPPLSPSEIENQTAGSDGLKTELITLRGPQGHIIHQVDMQAIFSEICADCQDVENCDSCFYDGGGATDNAPATCRISIDECVDCGGSGPAGIWRGLYQGSADPTTVADYHDCDFFEGGTGNRCDSYGGSWVDPATGTNAREACCVCHPSGGSNGTSAECPDGGEITITKINGEVVTEELCCIEAGGVWQGTSCLNEVGYGLFIPAGQSYCGQGQNHPNQNNDKWRNSIELIDPDKSDILNNDCTSWQLSRFRGGTPGAGPNQYRKGCNDPIAENYDPGVAHMWGGDIIFGGVASDPNSCEYIAGCMNSSAINYDPNATGGCDGNSPLGGNEFCCEFDFTALEPTIMGDVNQDGAVNVVDIVYLVNHILDCEYHSQYCLSDQQLANADVNDDNNINVVDVVNIVNHIFSRGYNSSEGSLDMLIPRLDALLRTNKPTIEQRKTLSLQMRRLKYNLHRKNTSLEKNNIYEGKDLITITGTSKDIAKSLQELPGAIKVMNKKGISLKNLEDKIHRVLLAIDKKQPSKISKCSVSGNQYCVGNGYCVGVACLTKCNKYNPNDDSIWTCEVGINF